MNDELDTCGCCAAPDAPAIDNLPGQPAIRFRLGTHSSFLADMKASLGSALPSLTTRAPDDPSIAMLDAGATLCDVLCFYQERIANEGYLRTATERRSVLWLARAIGYELNPGVAAGSYLAFTLEDPPQTPPIPLIAGVPLPPPPIVLPTTITIPKRTKVQSIPGGGELPQTFETLEDIEARTAWNAMRPRRFQRQQLSVESGKLALRDPTGAAASVPCGSVWLEGTSSGLRPGDLLVVHVTDANLDPTDPVSSGRHKGIVVAVVAAVRADDVNRQTRVDLTQAGATLPFGYPDRNDATIDTAPVSLTTDSVRDRVVKLDWDEASLAAFLAIQRWDERALADRIASLLAQAPPVASILVFRQRTGVFGSSAPASRSLPPEAGWPDFDGKGGVSAWQDSSRTTYAQDDLYLDRSVTGLIPGSLVGLARPGDAAPRLFALRGASEVSLADFAIAGKATALQLNDQADKTRPIAQWTARIATKDASFKMRTTAVYFQTEALKLADAPIADPVADPVIDADGGVTWAAASSVMLDRMVLGMAAGRVIALSGPTVDADGMPTGSSASEVATLERAVHTGGYTVLHFTAPLTHRYDRHNLLLSANVAQASHGETQPVVPIAGNQAVRLPGASQEEILGSGDGAIANQTFALSRLPLTFVSAASPSGGQSTLTVRVNGVAWTEVPSLYGQPPTARVYTLRIDDDGTTWVTCGDGVAGARLPTGQDNVTATYRSGIGTAGEVGAGRLTLLASRPPFVKYVTNPVGASGSQDREELDAARANAPRTVRTLDRIVSLADYQDFARSFAGVGKAQALAVWSGRTRIVHITVASATGAAIDPRSDTYRNLVAGIAASGDPSQPIQVDSFAPRFFRLGASVYCRPEHDRDEALAEVQAALADAFTFERRDFAQPVTDAEIIGIVQGIDGVLAVKIAALYPAEQVAPSISGVLPAAPARFDAATRKVLPAELLLLQPTGLTLSAVVS
ncbi:MAG TPA: baseplate J/gp47 family protein [Kofleriaceae bacterium]|nr:baseplate J/gp47 family protein [Kofleriaceae bacterium]